jgi:translation initiation factor 3 subunit M
MVDSQNSRHGWKATQAFLIAIVCFIAIRELYGRLTRYLDLDEAHLERKIRLLTLSTLGFKYIGQDLPYTKIAETLQIDVSQVESWIIDGTCSPPKHQGIHRVQYFTVIRAGLLSGKMSQSTQSLHVVRSTARVFEKEQWEALEKRVLAWRASLASVMEVVASAKRQAGFVPVPVA